VQLRHAEVLQHPPYGPYDGNLLPNGNFDLRTARATDLYILKGDANGESVEFSMSQHGFRYVELTFPGSPGEPPPSLDTIEVAYARSAVARTGALSFSSELLSQVHHNMLWGQASNLMMVPTDCDQRDERYGWTGDSAVTADEAAQNFDLGSFFHNWLRMIDDSSPKGAVPCWVPGGPGAGRGGGTGCDATWTSAFPSVAFAMYHWNGDITAPQKYWSGEWAPSVASVLGSKCSKRIGLQV
jgi:alpha-L-rhamnosidase